MSSPSGDASGDDGRSPPRSAHGSAIEASWDALVSEKCYFKIQTPRETSLPSLLHASHAAPPEKVRSDSCGRGIDPVPPGSCQPPLQRGGHYNIAADVDGNDAINAVVDVTLLFRAFSHEEEGDYEVPCNLLDRWGSRSIPYIRREIKHDQKVRGNVRRQNHNHGIL